MHRASKYSPLFLLVLLLTAALLFPQPISAVIHSEDGIVTKVADGDTVLVVTPEKTKLRVRLYGIDCPEIERTNRKTGEVSKPGQPYSKEAKNALANKVLNKEVRVDIMGKDRYKRVIAILWIGKRNINVEMVREGYAEAYREYIHEPFKSDYLNAEKEAKAQKKGIWSMRNYERPTDFRKRMRIRGGVNYG